MADDAQPGWLPGGATPEAVATTATATATATAAAAAAAEQLQSMASLPLTAELDSVLDAQIVSIDSYTAPPTSVDCALKTPYNIFEEPLKQVPVIRIFGATKSEQRICLHVHQVWPYMYVRYDGESNLESVREFGYQLGLSLNHALNISLKTTGAMFVAAVVPVKGVPFYGYHAGYWPFLKILFSSPGVVSRASNLLASGAVMNKKFDCFESHLPYTLQFLVDYNLFGMDWVHMSKALFRSPLPEPPTSGDARSGLITEGTVEDKHRWAPQGVPSYLVNPAPPERSSRCELEADAAAQDILNRRQVPERHIHHVPREDQVDLNFGKPVHSLNVMWADENQRRAARGMALLYRKDGQRQPSSVASQSASQLPLATPPKEAANAGLEWSNHWRMQSLFQSALANDQREQLGIRQSSLAANSDGFHGHKGLSPDWIGSRPESPSRLYGSAGMELEDELSVYIPRAAGSGSSWLDSWPTCREVDLGPVKLLSDGQPERTRFYLDLSEPPPSSQQSGCMESPGLRLDIGVFDELHIHGGSSQLSQPKPVVDVAAIVGNELMADEAKGSSDDEVPLGALTTKHLGDGSQQSDLDLLCEFAGVDEAWIESEFSKIEGQDDLGINRGHADIEYEDPLAAGAKKVPQLDGAGDASDSSGSDSRGGSKDRSLSRARRRYLAPLRLLPSSSSSSSPRALHLASSSGKRRKGPERDPVLSSCTSKAVQRKSDSPGGHAWQLDLCKQGFQSSGGEPSTFTASPAKRAVSETYRRPIHSKCDVFVDIPHTPGGYAKKLAASRSLKSSSGMSTDSEAVPLQTTAPEHKRASATKSRQNHTPYIDIAVSPSTHAVGRNIDRSQSLGVYDPWKRTTSPASPDGFPSSGIDGRSSQTSASSQRPVGSVTPQPEETASAATKQVHSPRIHRLHESAGRVFTLAAPPPTFEELQKSMPRYNIPEAVPPRPLFSSPHDVPKRSKSYAGSSFRLTTSSAQDLPIFSPTYASDTSRGAAVSNEERLEQAKRRHGKWSPAAVQQINASYTHQHRSHCMWNTGWWEFARRPPNPQQFFATQPLPDSSKNCTPPLHIGSDPSDIAATPVRKRQRDQSDLKWSSVLGKISKPPSAMPTQDSSLATTPQHSGAATPARQSRRAPDAAATRKKVDMSQASLEILTGCREQLLPDPKIDAVLGIVVCYTRRKAAWDHPCSGCQTIVWTCGPATRLSRLGFSSSIERRHQQNELSMILDLARWVSCADPDVLCGYEVQNSSWGYLIERAGAAYGLRLCSELSRIIEPPWRRPQHALGREQDAWGYRRGAAISIVGRHVLNAWRLMRSELSLTSYTFENIMREVFDEKTPHYSHDRLAAWYTSGPAVARIRALKYVLHRARAVLRILDKMDIISRASEFASIIGIDFHSVITRGSQLRVESLMARIAHPELFILSSPTREQVAQQRAAECVPLVLEPQSRYYTDPVVVLDFQSLYPSIMIAYNYCFSTCLGSIEAAAAADGADPNRRLGFASVHVPPGILTGLRDHITISPNGMAFVKPSVRRGLLGRMLQEILESRVMLKGAMATWGDDEALYKSLDARQLGLKLIANVTYGYAGASFSGRMPCVEIADAIVQSGRETLENAIRFIHSKHSTWGAQVVYGDTDSVFIHMPGKSRESAFRIGREIAEAVTALNPHPVELKFEKVYQPSVLLTKKRYAGWMYTSAGQTEPLLDVKGMELVRRDGCAVMQKIVEGSMDTLFRTNDLSLVKSYITAEITKVLQDEVSIKDFLIAKEARMGTYSAQVLPAHAKVAADAMQRDGRAEPQHGERVPYVVVDGGPGSRLTDQVVRPQVLLSQPGLRLNHQYYVDKQIVPALDRVFSLVGVDVKAWVSDMPRRKRSGLYQAIVDSLGGSDSEAGGDLDQESLAANECTMAGPGSWSHASEQGVRRLGGSTSRPVPRVAGRKPTRRTLDHFYHKRSCLLCQQTIMNMPPSPGRNKALGASAARICDACLADRTATMIKASTIEMDIGRAAKATLDQCAACAGGPRADSLQAAESCDSLDCPTMFQRHALQRRYMAWRRVTQELAG